MNKLNVNFFTIFSVFLLLSRQCLAQNTENLGQSIFLLSSNCATSGRGEIVEEVQEISVGKKFFSSKFHINNGSNTEPLLLTCSIDKTKQINTLLMNFAVKDYGVTINNISNKMVLKVFLDGREELVHSLSPGNEKRITVDVSKSESVALEVV